MKRFLTSTLGVVVAAAAAGGVLLSASGGARAAAPPPWEPDHSSVGGLVFYNAAGHVITGGSTGQPIAAYVEGTSTIRNGDNVATLYGFLPVHGEVPGVWSGEQLTRSTHYPNASAPAPVKSTSNPVVTGASNDETVAELASDYPNTDSSSDGYAHLYQIRLLTSKPQEGISTTYDSADISISGSTWTLVYSGAGTATSIHLSTSPAKAKYGAKVTLKATVSPATAAGKVQFRDGSKVIRSVKVSKGRASLTDSALPGGKNKITARFVPSSSTFAASTSAAKTVTVKTAKGTVKLKASASTVKAGSKLTLTATEKPKDAGTVTFRNGKARLGKAKVKGGKAKLVVKSLGKGTHHLTATFTPKHKKDVKSSTSKAVTVKVT
jgi:hypothetical protein